MATRLMNTPSKLAAFLAVALLLGGCTNLGPRALQAGRADYNEVLRDTADAQLLSNLVRLRYRDRPYYLEVSAVTTQFSFSPQLSATAGLGSPQIEQDVLLGAGGVYQEQPTVSYAPLQGNEFARRLLSPVTLDSLVRRLQVRDQMTSGFRRDGAADQPVIMFSESALASPEYQRLVSLLSLEPGRREYRVAPALRAGGGDVVGIQTRSLNGMLYYLAHAVEVPGEHLSRGLVNVTRREDGSEFDWRDLTGGLIQIRVSKERPAQAAVRVRYRDHWFDIDDADLDSKSTFSLLAQLFALQAGGAEGLRPVLTLPVGG